MISLIRTKPKNYGSNLSSEKKIVWEGKFYPREQGGSLLFVVLVETEKLATSIGQRHCATPAYVSVLQEDSISIQYGDSLSWKTFCIALICLSTRIS